MKSQNMESGLPIRESRWHKPAVYWTIPALFLLATFVISISLNQYYYHISGLSTDIRTFLTEVVIYIIVGIPTIIGAVELLRQQKEVGVVASLIALVIFEFYFWLVSFQHWYAWWGEYGADYNSAYDLQMKSIGIPLFVLDLIMIAFVIIGWRKVLQISKSSSSQNNSYKSEPMD